MGPNRFLGRVLGNYSEGCCCWWDWEESRSTGWPFAPLRTTGDIPALLPSTLLLFSPVSSQHCLVDQNDQERTGSIEEGGKQLGQWENTGGSGGSRVFVRQLGFHLLARAASPKLFAMQQGITTAPAHRHRESVFSSSSAEETTPNRKKIAPSQAGWLSPPTRLQWSLLALPRKLLRSSEMLAQRVRPLVHDSFIRRLWEFA